MCARGTGCGSSQPVGFAKVVSPATGIVMQLFPVADLVAQGLVALGDIAKFLETDAGLQFAKDKEVLVQLGSSVRGAAPRRSAPELLGSARSRVRRAGSAQLPSCAELLRAHSLAPLQPS